MAIQVGLERLSHGAGPSGVFKPSDFQELVSGRRRGASAAIARAGLRLIETPYAAAVTMRNWWYDRRAAAVERVPVPVVSVGNLTLGGTGKTPMVEWIARWIRRRDVRVTIISRGYGAEAGARNDEALELEQKLPDVPHLQNPNRIEAARLAIEEFGCQWIVLDDAFQHRRIARDLDVVMLDASVPFGFGHVFPRGLLREPPSGLRRASVVALARADMLEPSERSRIRKVVERHAPGALWAETAHVPRLLLAADGTEKPVESLLKKPVAALCGIGNPAGFLHTLETCDMEIEGFREYPDHHRYTREDVEELCRWAERLDVAAILCTHKDLVKLRVERLGRHPLRAVTVGLEFLSGREEVENRLGALMTQVRERETGAFGAAEE